MEDLKLVLKQPYYRDIDAHVKREEYRRITPFWLTRIFGEKGMENGSYVVRRISKLAAAFFCNNLDCLIYAINIGELVPLHDKVTFHHGYAKDRPSMRWNIDGIEIRGGRTEWGAVKGERYFVIKLKDRI